LLCPWRRSHIGAYNTGVIGMGAASMGVRFAKADMGNVPTPSKSRLVTFFWKKSAR
jgi:hypothetical protein